MESDFLMAKIGIKVNTPDGPHPSALTGSWTCMPSRRESFPFHSNCSKINSLRQDFPGLQGRSTVFRYYSFTSVGKLRKNRANVGSGKILQSSFTSNKN